MIARPQRWWRWHFLKMSTNSLILFFSRAGGYSPTLECGWDLMTCNKYSEEEVMICHFGDCVIKALRFPFRFPSLSPSLSLTPSPTLTQEENSCCLMSCPMERSTWQETESGLWPTARKELRPSVQGPKRN